MYRNCLWFPANNNRRLENVAVSKHSIPKMAKLSHDTCTGKEKDTGVKERNLAIARYYKTKTEKVDLEIQLLKTQLNHSRSRDSLLPNTPIRWDDDA